MIILERLSRYYLWGPLLFKYNHIFYQQNHFDCYLVIEELLAYYPGSQVVPHITDAIKNRIERVSSTPVDGKRGPADVCVIELGGTVGMS